MFMIHKEHGATNVPDGEVEAHEKMGWKKSTADEWFRMNGKEYLCKDNHVDVKQESHEANEPDLEVPQANKKPGRKPKQK